MSRLATAIWIEDQPESVEEHLPLLAELGIRCEIAHVRDFEKVTSKRHFDLGIFDARFDIGEEDGVDLARTLVYKKAIEAVLVVTRFRDSYAEAEKKINPYIPVRVVPKTDMKRSSTRDKTHRSKNDNLSFTSISDILVGMESDLSHISKVNIDAPVMSSKDFPVGNMTVGEFYALPSGTQIELAQSVNSLYRPFVDDLFSAKPEIDWIVVGAPTGEVLLWGTDHEDAPEKIQRIQVIAKEAVERCVPFTFVRPTRERY